jgi:hypothetical protein
MKSEMQKTEQTSTKLLVIAITTAAIIAAAIISSISLARPAFAKFNCTTSGSVSTCSGGTSRKAEGSDVPGGRGGHFTADTSTGELTRSGGGGVNNDVTVGGGGSHTVCDPSGCSKFVGGTGAHPK